MAIFDSSLIKHICKGQLLKTDTPHNLGPDIEVIYKAEQEEHTWEEGLEAFAEEWNGIQGVQHCMELRVLNICQLQKVEAQGRCQTCESPC